MSAAPVGARRPPPELAEVSAMARALATAVDDFAAVLPDGVPHLGAAEERLRAGIAALDGEPLCDGASWRAQLLQLAALLRTVSPHGADAVDGVATIVGALAPDAADELAHLAQIGEWTPLTDIAQRLGAPPDALIALADHAARPALRAGAARVASLVGRAGWRHGACPACGEAPVLAELRGPERVRVLRCARCLSAWEFARLGCPGCGTSDHQQLGALHAPGEAEFRRADTCDACHCYVKAVAALDPLGAAQLAETDLATLALDVAAAERGYHRLLRG